MQLYWQLLNCLNITYTITFILLKQKFRFLNFLVFDISNTNIIKKTKIFVDNIFKNIERAEYLKN